MMNRHSLCPRQLISPMNVRGANNNDRIRELVTSAINERGSEARSSFGR